MQYEMACLSCPLCKLQLPTDSYEQTLKTRLCESCQTMVLAAFRGPDSIVAASTAVVPQGVSIPLQLQGNASVVPDLFAAGPGDVAPFDTELRPPIPFDPPDFDFYKDEDLVDRIPSVRADSLDCSKHGSRQGENLFEVLVHSVSVADPEYARVDESHLVAQPANLIEEPVESEYDVDRVVEIRNESIAPEDVVTDPWEAPLAAWDYSHSEWPVLVGPDRRKTFTTVRWAVAIVVVLASAAAFFLVYRSANPQRAADTDAGTTNVSAGDTQLVDGSADSPAQSPVAQTQPDKTAPASQPAEAASGEAVESNGGGAQGRFSLQAAAFPTQDGADEFAVKLKRAGLPSYVVPADLARRGRWFRVRIGRFNTAENAQRFAGEARQRARVAGLSVQVIVCQFDQP